MNEPTLDQVPNPGLMVCLLPSDAPGQHWVYAVDRRGGLEYSMNAIGCIELRDNGWHLLNSDGTSAGYANRPYVAMINCLMRHMRSVCGDDSLTQDDGRLT